MTANSLSLAIVSGAIGAALWFVGVFVWSVLNAPREEDARVRSQRDRAELDFAIFRDARQAEFSAATAEFAKRLGEGNQLSFPPRSPDVRGLDSIAKNRALRAYESAYRRDVERWRDACRATAEKYLRDLAWQLDKPIPEPSNIRPRRWHDQTRREVAVTIDRMGELQQKLIAQSSSSAISSQVQT